MPNPSQIEPVKYQPTGIAELDEMLAGGVPESSVVLISGSSGTGKTILSQQWLFAGYAQYQEPGIYIGLLEPIAKTLRNASQFSFYNADAIGEGKVEFTDIPSVMRKLSPEHKVEWKDIEQIISALRDRIEKTKARRIVIDSVTALLFLLETDELRRAFLSRFNEMLAEYDITAFLISELHDTETYSVFCFEEFISDGIIALRQTVGEQAIIRSLDIVKLRGTAFRSGAVDFEITQDGFIIYPKMPIDRRVTKTDFNTRLTTGVPVLDEMTGGGIPQGHTVLISGNTGTGKTTFALHYIFEGLEKGEPAVFIALEESVTQLRKTAAAHGWDLEPHEFEERLAFINPSLIDIYPDKLLYNILREVERLGAKRIVLDSVSSLESSAFDRNDVREFLLQLSYFLKKSGATAILTYLAPGTFEARAGQLIGSGPTSQLRVSSIADGIILLRYVERNEEAFKLVNVLKMRGINHDRRIRHFWLTDHGIEIGEQFNT